MRPRNTLAGLALLVVAVGSTSQTLWADNGPYTVQDAGPANGVALGVNASAVVVGTSGAATLRTAFLTPFGSGPQLLAGLVGSSDDAAFGVHPDGWAVGHSFIDFFAKPVTFQSGSAVDLEPLALTGAARAINQSGVIAGWVYDEGTKAVIWTNGNRLEVPGTFYAQAFALNNAGVVTGTYYGPDNTLRAFTWSSGTTPVVLPSLGGFTSEGNGINEQGDVVGDSMPVNSVNERAVWWTAAGQLAELGTFGGPASSARDINNHRQIVGYALDGSLEPRAFLSEAGGPIVDLNTLLPPDSGWVLLSANAINDAGQIVGEGMLNGEARAFLLTPPVASDTTPPVISSVTTTPNSIWPPRHQMVDVSVRVVASDDSGETPVCSVLSVASSEPDNGEGDGNTASDTQVVGPGSVRVRAERSGPVVNRVYTVTVQCSDGSGNVAAGVGTVTIGEASVLKTSSNAKAKK
jgi:probable HAF family extracellular repeat protein